MKKNNLGKLIHLKKLCTDKNHFQMLAVDQRPPIFNLITDSTGQSYTYSQVVECKRLITQYLSKLATAILMDPHYSLSNILRFNQSKGLVITLEEHSFIETQKGRYSRNIDNWSVEKIKKAGNVANFARDNNLANLEFLSCIPGTVGGGIKMNAGCFNREFKDILISVQAINKLGQVTTIPAKEIDFKYRDSGLSNDLIFLSASLKGF